MALPKLPQAVGSKRQALLFGVLALLLVLAVVRWRPGVSAPAAPAAVKAQRPDAAAAADEPVSPRGKKTVKEVSADEVPSLSAEDFSASAGHGPADTGRNLFDLREPTRKPPPTPFPPPPPPGDARFVGPLPPPPPTPTPRPPEISFKFIGTFGPKKNPIAVIQQGDLIYNVRQGDVLFNKFVLRKVGYESIDVGFVAFPSAEPVRIAIVP
jgi:hypothetical protein